MSLTSSAVAKLASISPALILTLPGPPSPIVSPYNVSSSLLLHALAVSRAVKLPQEIELIAAATAASLRAHAIVQQQAAPGDSEGKIAALFRFSCEDCGMPFQALGIPSPPPHSHKLHHFCLTAHSFQRFFLQIPAHCCCRRPRVHSPLHERERHRRCRRSTGACARSMRVARGLTAGQLVDAAAQVMGYCADITRTTPIGAAMSDDQRLVWNAVHDTLQASLLLHVAGTYPPPSLSMPTAFVSLHHVRLHQVQNMMKYTVTRRCSCCATSCLLGS